MEKRPKLDVTGTRKVHSKSSRYFPSFLVFSLAFLLPFHFAVTHIQSLPVQVQRKFRLSGDTRDRYVACAFVTMRTPVITWYLLFVSPTSSLYLHLLLLEQSLLQGLQVCVFDNSRLRSLPSQHSLLCLQNMPRNKCQLTLSFYLKHQLRHPGINLF